MIWIALSFGLCAGMSADGAHVRIGYRANASCEFQHEWGDKNFGWLGDRRAFVEIIDGGATIGIEDLEFTIVAMEGA